MRLCLLAEMNGDEYTIPGAIQLTDEKWTASEYILFPIEEQEIADYINANKGELGTGLFLKNVMRKHYPENYIRDLSLSLKSGEDEYYLPLIKGEDKDIVSFFEEHHMDGISLPESKGFLIIRDKTPWSLPGNPFISGACLKAYIRSRFEKEGLLSGRETSLFHDMGKGMTQDTAEENEIVMKIEEKSPASDDDRGKQPPADTDGAALAAEKTYDPVNDTETKKEDAPKDKKDPDVTAKKISEKEPGKNEELSDKAESEEDDGFFDMLQDMLS